MPIIDSIEKVNLTEISNELYRKHNGIYLEKPTNQQLKNFLSKNIKYLHEIFKALQIMDYMRYIKPNFSMDENGYEFSIKSKGFLMNLLDNYTNTNVLELRRGHWDKVSDRCIVWIVEGMYKVFLYNNIPEEDLNKIGIIMSNLTNYPVRLRFGKIFQMTYDLEYLAGMAYWPKWKTNLSGDDNCVWLDALKEDLKLFVAKWKYIYDSMGEIRQLEVNDIAEKNYVKMTAEQTLRAEIEFALAEPLGDAVRNDEKLKKLEDELNKEIVYKKTGYYVDKQDSLEYMRKRIIKRREEIEQEVFSKYCADIDVPSYEDITEDNDFDDMKLPDEILKDALEDYSESLIPFPKIELPDIDIDAVIEQFKIERNLKRNEKGGK